MSCQGGSSNVIPARAARPGALAGRAAGLARWPLAVLFLALLGACHPDGAQRSDGPEELALDAAGRAFYVSLPTRPEARQPFLLLLPPQPRAVALLFPGGDGASGLAARGTLREGEGLLVTGRERLVAAGLAVALLAPPTDRESLRGFRTSAEHAQDVQAALAWLRRRLGRPVWLVGASRGTISAASVAARLAGAEGPDGLVLASALTVENEGESVYSAELAAIRIPTLLVQHRQDACPVTPFSGAERLLRALAHAPAKALLVIEGGGPPTGLPCTATHYHGFVGRQAEALQAIAAWILAHPPAPAPGA